MAANLLTVLSCSTMDGVVSSSSKPLEAEDAVFGELLNWSLLRLIGAAGFLKDGQDLRPERRPHRDVVSNRSRLRDLIESVVTGRLDEMGFDPALLEAPPNSIDFHDYSAAIGVRRTLGIPDNAAILLGPGRAPGNDVLGWAHRAGDARLPIEKSDAEVATVLELAVANMLDPSTRSADRTSRLAAALATQMDDPLRAIDLHQTQTVELPGGQSREVRAHVDLYSIYTQYRLEVHRAAGKGDSYRREATKQEVSWLASCHSYSKAALSDGDIKEHGHEVVFAANAVAEAKLGAVVMSGASTTLQALILDMPEKQLFEFLRERGKEHCRESRLYRERTKQFGRNLPLDGIADLDRYAQFTTEFPVEIFLASSTNAPEAVTKERTLSLVR